MKINLNDIKNGSLVNETFNKTVEFISKGETCSVDVNIKQLPFSVTDPIYKKLHDDESTAVSELIALSLVDDNEQTIFTPEQVTANFTQSLANALIDAILGLDSVKKPQPVPTP